MGNLSIELIHKRKGGAEPWPCVTTTTADTFVTSRARVCDKHNDVATATLIENWLDETERRTLVLAEIIQDI